MDTLTAAGLGLLVVPVALAIRAAKGRLSTPQSLIQPSEENQFDLDELQAQLDSSQRLLCSIEERRGIANLPVRMDRRAAAAMITQYFFPISPRTLEVWPLAKRRLNGKALYETADLIAYASARVAASSATRRGDRPHS